MKEIKDVTITIGITEDDHFRRTAVKLDRKNCSFDILDMEGNLIARINVLDTEKYYDIDIIRNEDSSESIKVLAWNGGNPIINQDLPKETKVLATLLMKHPK